MVDCRPGSPHSAVKIYVSSNILHVTGYSLDIRILFKTEVKGKGESEKKGGPSNHVIALDQRTPARI